MQIERYSYSPQTVAELVDLIMYCQNTEAHLGIKMREQADVFEISQYYQKNGGDFWVARDQGQVVGSIGLLKCNEKVGVLKKFFTYPTYRGRPQRLGQHLWQTLAAYVQTETQLTQLVLDTPEAETRSHYFYEKNGFQRIDRQQLPVSYAFPDRESLIYSKTITR
ncbi:GNAT family N-acetyltransferase [Levilactobacillus enshiensis]|uniref:GNAT family N-acetyltransferase n=1 Tax=Levilactobacillus enshiensis TaxID=2590213 RepID=UPI00117AA00F|nr:GNAT family N-acetyltransferase [Levilactobacillus enshiensis]